MPDILAETRRHRARVLEGAELGMSGEGGGGEADHGHRPEHDQSDAETEIDPLVAHEARRDPLVDDVALLEEELPGSDRRADDRDDEQHDLAQPPMRQLRNDKIMRQLRHRRMYPDEHRNEQQAARHEEHGEPLEPPEIARAGGGNHERGGG